MSPSRLEDRVSLVDRNINFTTDMSVRQTILFHSLMREPGTLTRGRDTKGRVSLSLIIFYPSKRPKSPQLKPLKNLKFIR